MITASQMTNLSIAFTVFNALRVYFYIPSFKLMIKQKNNLESHSLFTWFSWIFANATVAIYFVILSGWDEKAILNLANAFMCLVGFSIILYKRKKYKNVHQSGMVVLEEDGIDVEIMKLKMANKKLCNELS